MQTRQSVAYEMFVALRAARTGKSEIEVQAETSPDEFDRQLRELHQRYMNREVTIGKLADLLEVPTLNLYDILDEMGLSVRYT